MYDNSSSTINTQSWFIPFDILNLICLIFAVLLASIFLLIILTDKTCHTVPMMLVTNSCVAELLLGSDLFGMAVFVLRNDLYRIQYQDSLCLFRGYLGIALHRYMTVVYPIRLNYLSVRFQFLVLCLTWIGAIIYVISLAFTNQFEYHVDDQICQMPIRLSFLTIFNALYVYLIPMSTIKQKHKKL